MKTRIKMFLLSITLMILVNPLAVSAVEYYVEIEGSPSSPIREGTTVPASPGTIIDFEVKLLTAYGGTTPQPVAAGEQVTVTLSRSGDAVLGADADFTLLDSLSLLFHPGQSSKTVRVQVVQDDIYESNQYKSIILALSSGVCSVGSCDVFLGSSIGVAEIRDDENKAFFSESYLSGVNYLQIAEDEQSAATWDQLYTVGLERPIPPGATETYTIDWQVDNSYAESATAGSDYLPASGIGTIVFKEGDATKDIVITVNNDNVMEEPYLVEFLDLTISSVDPSLEILVGFDEIWTDIYDNDNELTFTETSREVKEQNPGEQTYEVELAREIPTYGPTSDDIFSVPLIFADGTATSGTDEDYEISTAGPLVFNNDIDTKMQEIVLQLNDDPDVEPDETIIIELADSYPESLKLLENEHVTTILDNDSVITLQTPSPYQVEEDSSVPITLQFNTNPQPQDGAGEEVTMVYTTQVVTDEAVDGADFTGTTGLIKFIYGEPIKSITIGTDPSSDIVILDDDINEGAETFEILFSDFTGNATFPDTNPITITIVDFDYWVTVNDNNDVTEDLNDNSGASPEAYFTLSLDRMVRDEEAVAVNWTTQALTPVDADGTTDFTPETGIVYFCGKDFSDATPYTGSDTHKLACETIGETGRTRDVPITILDDGIKEDLEKFEVILSVPATGGTGNVSFKNLGDEIGVILITDDDYEITEFNDVSVEEDGSVTLTVKVDPPVPSDEYVYFTVDHAQDTALDSGEDYTAPTDTELIINDSATGTITIKAGATGAKEFNINDDDLVEFAETFKVMITPVGEPATPDKLNASFADTIDGEAIVTINVQEKYVFSIAANVSELESVGTIVFPVTLESPVAIQDDHKAPLAATALELSYSTTDGSAIKPDDYDETLTSSPFPVSTGSPVTNLTIWVNDDDMSEDGAELFNVKLSAAGLYYEDIITFTQDTGQGEIRDSDYIVTPTWNIHGDVSLTNGTLTPAIESGTAITILNLVPAAFTVDADYRINEVKINDVVVTSSGINTGTLPDYITIADGGDETIKTYTFKDNTPAGSNKIDILFDHQITMEVSGDGSGTFTHSSLNGTAAPDDDVTIGAVIADHGLAESFEIEATSGCLTGLYLDDVNVGAFASGIDNWSGNTYIIPSVTDNHSLNAEFDRAAIKIEIHASDPGDTPDIQDPGSGSGWRAYVADSSFNPVGVYFASGKHDPDDPAFTIPDDIPGADPCNTRYLLVEFLDADGWLKPADIHIDLQYAFHDQTHKGYYDADAHVLALGVREDNDGPFGDVEIDVMCRDSYILCLDPSDGSLLRSDASCMDTEPYDDVSCNDPHCFDPHCDSSSNGRVVSETVSCVEDCASDNPVNFRKITYLYQSDTPLKLTATNRGEYFFHVYSGDLSSGTSSADYTLDQDSDIEAVFKLGCQDADGDQRKIRPPGDTTCDMGGYPEDCDDSDPSVYPGATEICEDGIDQDCDGSDPVCEGDYSDDDGDGYTEMQGDCDDVVGSGENIHPGAYDIPGNGINEDCFDGSKRKGSEINTCDEISDTPANVAKSPAPPMLMFLIDDSGSMEWEFMTEEGSGLMNSDYFIYQYQNNLVTGAYGNETWRRVGTSKWKARWSGYNRIYFDPSASYQPWPRWEELLEPDGSTITLRTGETEHTSGPEVFPYYQYDAVHAHMDFPRVNTYEDTGADPGNIDSIKSWYHPGTNGTGYDLELGATFMTVEGNVGYRVSVTRDNLSGPKDADDQKYGDTRADAIGLQRQSDYGTQGNLQNQLNSPIFYITDYTDPPYPAYAPEFIFDDSQSTSYSESDNWEPSTYTDTDDPRNWKWLNSSRWTDVVGETATWDLAGIDLNESYYVYAWVDNYPDSDDNARYTVSYWDTTTNSMASDVVRINQQPDPDNDGVNEGPRWLRIAEDDDDPPYYFKTVTEVDIDIPNAHYFTTYDEDGDEVIDHDEVFLVTIGGDASVNGDSGSQPGDYTLRYYQFINNDDNDTNDSNLDGSVDMYDRLYKDDLENGELTELSPAEVYKVKPVRYKTVTDVDGKKTKVKVDDDDELAFLVRQDFANWFSFYRRRMLTAKSAIGLTVVDMVNVELGVHGINHDVSQPLQLITSANSEEMRIFLQHVYDADPIGNTPLREGLWEVGKYYDRYDVDGGGTYVTSNDEWNSYDDSTLRTSAGETCEDGTSQGNDSVYWDAAKNEVSPRSCDDTGGACQRAYVIAMTDGHYNRTFSRGLTDDDVDPHPDFSRRVRKAFISPESDTLGDIAMHFYLKDLHGGLQNQLDKRGFDDATWQHMVTYGVAFGVFGNYNPEDFPDCLPTCDTPGELGCPKVNQLRQIEYDADIGKYKSGFMDAEGKIKFGKKYWRTEGPFRYVCPDWPENSDGRLSGKQTVDDLYHASVNGRGAFLNAANPTELVEAMEKIKSLIQDQTGTASSVSINSRKIEEGTLLYQTEYNSQDWSGDFVAKCLDITGKVSGCDQVACEEDCNTIYNTCEASCYAGDPGVVDGCLDTCRVARTSCVESSGCRDWDKLSCAEAEVACESYCASAASGDPSCATSCTAQRSECDKDPREVKWSAAQKLDELFLTGSHDDRDILTADAGGNGQPFRAGSVGGMLDVGIPAVDYDDIVNYIRGDSSLEVKNGVDDFRNRSVKLGDFLNSEPLHYSNADYNWVFAGANDGMLHVFDAVTGEEIFGYVPNFAFEYLHELTLSSYNFGHRYFVDGNAYAQDLGGAVILFGALGKGGKGYFALNLSEASVSTDIEADADKIVVWEYPHKTSGAHPPADGSDLVDQAGDEIIDLLGYTYSKPQIVKSNSSEADWLLVFGNGYESESKRAILFLVGLDDDGNYLWTHTIDTGEFRDDDDKILCNGLSTPAIIYPQGDGHKDYIFAGDLLGHMWKFDISSDNRNDWGVFFEDGADNPKPLFEARSEAGYRQPITIQPDVTISCVRGGEGYMVAFGTGRLFNPDKDADDFSVQSVYGIWDWSDMILAEIASPTADDIAAVKQLHLGYFGNSDDGTPPTGECMDNTLLDLLGTDSPPDSDWLISSKTVLLADYNLESLAEDGTDSCVDDCAGNTECIETCGESCVYNCSGNDECIEICVDSYLSNRGNCESIRVLSNMDTALTMWKDDVCSPYCDAEKLDCDASCSAGDPGDLAECQDECTSQESTCDAGCTIDDSYVTLLRQTQVYVGGINYDPDDGSIDDQDYGATDLDSYDEIVRVMSANEIDWLLPSDFDLYTKEAYQKVKHMGWFFDLPMNGERVVRDVSIVNNKLIFTTTIPSDSPCEGGGTSNHWAVDVCSGARADHAFFDLNSNDMIGLGDYINIGTEANPIWVAPSSIQVDGLSPAPSVFELENNLDRLYFPDQDDSEGVSESFVTGFGIPIQFWRELDWQ